MGRIADSNPLGGLTSPVVLSGVGVGGWRREEPVAYAVAYTGPQRDSAAVFSVEVVRSEAETSIAASFKTAAFVRSATPPGLNLNVGPYG